MKNAVGKYTTTRHQSQLRALRSYRSGRSPDRASRALTPLWPISDRASRALTPLWPVSDRASFTTQLRSESHLSAHAAVAAKKPPTRIAS